MKLLLLSLLSFTIYAAEAVKLPAEAQSAIDKADKSISGIQNKADSEIMKVRQALVAILTRTQEAVTRRGDLDTALAIKAKVEELQKLMPDDLGNQEPKIKLKPEDWILGDWELSFPGFSKIWEFKKDGTVTFSGGPIGKWVVKDTVIQVNWPSGNVETVDIPKNLTSSETTGTAGSGRKFVVIRTRLVP